VRPVNKKSQGWANCFVRGPFKKTGFGPHFNCNLELKITLQHKTFIACMKNNSAGVTNDLGGPNFSSGHSLLTPDQSFGI